MFDSKKSLFVSFILKLFPLVGVVFVLTAAGIEWRDYHHSLDEFETKLSKLSSTYSLVIAEAVAEQDLEKIELLLASMLADQDVAYISIQSLPDNTLLSSYGQRDLIDEALLERRRINKIAGGDILHIGNIEIGLTTEHIQAHLIEHIQSYVVAFLILLFTFFFSTRYAYQQSMGIRLAQLLESISKFKSTGQHEDIHVVHEDELSLLTSTYNQMQRQQLANRARLDAHRETLEDQVEERSKALRKELKDHQATSEQLFSEKERLHVVLASIQDAVISTDNQGRATYLNPAALKLLSKTSVKKKPITSLVNLTNKQATFEAYVETCLDAFGKQILNLQDEMTTPNDVVVQAEITVSSILDKADQSAGVVVVIHDATLAKQQHEQLHFQATHDALTKLLNRNEFELRLEQALQSSMTDDAVHTLCFLDLDQFKVVNDVAGHIAGDELLIQLSHMLNQHIWKRDVLARIGGDEFAILMEHCDVEDAANKAESIRSLIEDFRFVWEQHVFSVGVSIGLVQVNKFSVNTTQVLQKADLACYAAKERGRNRVHVYQEHDEVMAKHEGDMYWASQVQAAIDADKFMLFAQRIAPVAANDEWMFEVLVRMTGDDGNTIPPGAFLPAVERYNLAHKLDRWVIDHALAWLDNHEAVLDNLKYLSINLSGATLGDASMLDFIRARLIAAGPLASKVTFEVTETHAVSNLREATAFIQELKTLGCSFALDDFGSGLSSFAYLKNLPVDYLKIDGVFVKDVLDDPIDAAMVRSITDIGRVMGMETVAEFVENDEIRTYLKEINVNYVQGYGVAKPQPIDELLGYFEAKSA